MWMRENVTYVYAQEFKAAALFSLESTSLIIFIFALEQEILKSMAYF